MRTRTSENGFVISIEVLLIAVVLAAGLIAGWAKLRDQSLSEMADTMAAIDAYIAGSATKWQTGGTRWLKDGAIVEPSVTPAVTETWTDEGGSSGSASAAEPVPGDPGVYRTRDGFLVYGATPTPSTTSSGAGETAP